MAPDVQESTGTQPANDLDADQIHNLINMAMANAYDTVSSWLQPPSAAVLEADEKLRVSNQDFEKMAFRPARLGVGATAPSVSTIKEMYKLKQKLSGTKRKADEMDSSSGKGKSKQDVDETDEDEDSKSRSISKKAKLAGTSALSPFDAVDQSGSSGKKKKKKKKKGGEHIDPNPDSLADADRHAALLPRDPGPSISPAPTLRDSAEVSSQAVEEEPIPKLHDEEAVSESADAPTSLAEPTESSAPDGSEKKRKKKRKKNRKASVGDDEKPRLDEGVDAQDDDGGGEEWLGISPSVPPPESDISHPSNPLKTGMRASPDRTSSMPLESSASHKHSFKSRKSPTQTASFPPLGIPPPVPLIPSSPPTTLARSQPSPSSISLPRLPNGESSSPHRKKRKEKREKRAHRDTLPLVLKLKKGKDRMSDEQSSEATLVSSSDHTGRMTSPRE